MAKDDTGRAMENRASASVLLNGLHVLEAFSIDEPILGVTEIARKVNQHKSTVSRILATLERAGYVEREEGNGRFRLGLGLIALAGPLLADLDVRRVALRSLQQLTQRTGETTALMVWNGHEAVVVEQVQSPKQVKHTAAIGTRYDTYESSSVKVFLAALPAGEVTRLFERHLRVGTYDEHTLESYAAELDRVAEQGFAINDGRTSVEEVGVAAPVRDHRGVVVAAVLLSAPRFRVPPAMLDVLARSVSETAAEVSARLGGTTPR
ncbi:MAG TPA: IclR family transcriptional regulator [Intrasporangium sp.]|uniref:IclR family transcriptional regulator n=1 Tax=Intrasporangium sp. TaxID=1925024 RepID=UPI002D7755D7|nr:IclR family transcriptional regulator [Intrasporangium sp.]HET7396959.1 IclR family transcriptional regulator [Intrasporangium sp.]